jgi:Hsp20/alpha crystallin family
VPGAAEAPGWIIAKVPGVKPEVDAEKIRASCDPGVVTVTLPKAETAKPRQIPVELQSR